MNTMLPVCSQCNQPIVLIDAAKRCTNPACGKVVCFLCAARKINFCWACSNPLTALVHEPLVTGNTNEALARPAALDVLAATEQVAFHERQEASQRRIEENAKETARKQLELEAKRLEIERGRAAEDQQHREDATRIRRIASMTAALAESLRTFSQERPGWMSSSDPFGGDGAPLEFCGATCEVLHHALGHLLNNSTARANIYLTQDDLGRIYNIEECIKELRTNARHATFVAVVLRLLADHVSRVKQTIMDFGRLHSALRDAANSFRIAVYESGVALAWELALFTLPEKPQSDHGEAVKAIVAYCGDMRVKDGRTLADVIAGVNLTAVRGCHPDDSRMHNGVAHVQRAITHLRQQCDAIQARCRTVLNAGVRELTNGSTLIALVVTDHSYKGIVSEIVPGDFVEQLCGQSTPPESQALKCSEGPMLLYHVATAALSGRLGATDRPVKTVGPGLCAGGISLLRMEAADVARAVAAFVADVSQLDKIVTGARDLPAFVEETLQGACSVCESLARIMKREIVQKASSDLAADLTKASQLFTRAQHLVEIGEVALGIRLGAVAAQTLQVPASAGELQASIEKQRRRVAAIEKSYESVVDEFSRRAKGFAGLIRNVFDAASQEALLERVTEFYRHQEDVCLGPGTEVARQFATLIRAASKYCDIIGYTPRLRLWVTLHDAIEQSQSRMVSPEVAFANAICAMAAIQGSIDRAEAEVLRASMQGLMHNGGAVTVDRVIDEWRGIVVHKQLLLAVAQAIVDIDAIGDGKMLEQLERQLRKVAKADGKLSDTEATVYYALLARVARRLYKSL